jgi:ligand-binding sensor domain-containing protein/signal transduction histidine kinase/DNA-binding response OmpR family regulator
MQDTKGFLWLGTKDGLNKFDGVNFTVYRHTEGNNKSIGNNYIQTIIEGKNNTFYVGTDDGLYIMHPIDGSFEKLETKLNVVDKIITSVSALQFDKNGLLWIATRKEGVYVFDPQKMKLSRVRSLEYDLTKTTVWTVFIDKSGSIWVGSRSGLFQYNPNKKLLEAVNGVADFGNNSNMEILTIFEDEQGNLWLGSWSDGILFYNKQQKGAIAYCGPNDITHYITHIHTFLQYDDNNLLVGADDGLYLFNTTTQKADRIDVPYDKYSLGDQNVYSLLRDRENGIWVGTYFGGLNYLNKSVLSIKNYLPNNKNGSLSGKAISQFCEDEKGNLWVATEDGGLNYFDTKTEKFSQPIKTSYHNIHPLMLVGDELWIGTFSRGLDVYNTKTKKLRHYRNRFDDKNSLDDDCVFSLYRTSSGDIYVGTTNGLNKYNPLYDNFTRIISDSISFIYDIKEDSYQQLWLAMYNNNGAAKLNLKTNKWTYYSNVLNENDPMVNSKLTGIHIDNQKRLWFSSEDKGIFLYDYEEDSFLNLSEKDGLPNNVVYGILDDQFGNIWISSNKGLVSFPPFDLKAQKHYTQGDGIQSNEFNYKSSFRANDGKLYFGGINGFNSFYPQELIKNINDVIPPVEITGMRLLGYNDKNTEEYISNCINNKEPIRLKHNNSSFTISFVSLSYIAPTKNKYAYKLEGVDEDWNHIGNNPSVTYVDLAPGKYTFRVKASNNHNIWNENGAALKFEILPPFWFSLPAKILYIITVILILYLFLIYYSKRHRIEHQKQLEAYKMEQETLSFKSKIDFFTNIAHEIRTPVSLIKAPLEEIISSEDGNVETKQNLSIIEKNSDRLNVLINQLLDFRKMDSAEYTINPNNLNLTRHLYELYDRFRKTAQKQNIDFQIIVPQQKTEIYFDADALTKIIGNFLTNALKYTKDTIVLKLIQSADESFTISVSDNGKGIPDTLKAKIFDPFYQIKSHENTRGTGIGLSLAKHLSEMLGGNIMIEENPTGGSIFSFTFRELSENKSAENYQKPEENTTKEFPLYHTDDRTNILIVEDNPEMLHFIENSLKSEHKVNIAESAAQAMILIDENSYDLIITDVMMPDTDGIEFTRQLRENISYSHIPVILLSAKTDNITKIEGLNAGADVFIEKPFSTLYLKAQISRLLTNRKAILESFNHSPLAPYSILTSNKSDLSFINRLNEEIDKNISDSNFSIESLTDKLFISRSNLQRKLKSICGYTPGDYLRTYRLKKATQLLLEDGLRINEVAYEVGFSSASYFTKCFVKQFGLLPKDFVKQHSAQ